MNQRQKFSSQLLKEMNSLRKPRLPLYSDNIQYHFLQQMFIVGESIDKIVNVISRKFENQQSKLIYETFEKSRVNQHSSIFFSEQEDNVSQYSRSVYQKLFNKILQENSELIEGQNFTHSHIHLHETSTFYIILVIQTQKSLIIDQVQFRQKYIMINGWSLGRDSQICGASISYESDTVILGPGCIKRQNYNDDIQVIEIKCSNQLISLPAIHLEDYGLETPQIIFYSGPIGNDFQDTLSYIPSCWVELLSISLFEVSSQLSDRNYGNFGEFIYHIYNQWNQARKSLDQRRSLSEKENRIYKTDISHIQICSRGQNEKINPIQVTGLPPIYECAAENFASSAKNLKQKNVNNDMDKFTCNLLEKYGLDDPSQSDKYDWKNKQMEGNNNFKDEIPCGIFSQFRNQTDFSNSQQVNHENIYPNQQTGESFKINDQYFERQTSSQQNFSINQQQQQNVQPQQNQLLNQQQQQNVQPQQNQLLNQQQQQNVQPIHHQYNNFNNQQQQINEFQQQQDNQLDQYQFQMQKIHNYQYMEYQQWNQYQQFQLFLQQQQQQQYQLQYQLQQQLLQQQLQQQSQQQQNLPQYHQKQEQEYVLKHQDFQKSEYNFKIDENSVFIKQSLNKSVRNDSLNKDLIYDSEQGLKHSLNHSQIFYSSCKKISQGDSIRPFHQDEQDNFPRKMDKRYSIRQLKLDSNRIQSEKLNKSKLEQIGGFPLYNLVDYKPNIKLNEIQPFDFYEYTHNHAKKKIEQIMEDLRSYNKPSCIRSFSQLYKDEKFVDLTLKLHDKEFKTHKTVLIYVSSYFKQLIGTVGAQFSTIRLENQIDRESFPSILKFIYLQHLPQSEWEEFSLEQGRKLLQTSIHFKIINLSDQIVAKIVIPKMNIQYCIGWFSLCCKGKTENSDFIYLYGYLYTYLLRYFSIYAKSILAPVRKFYAQIISDQEEAKQNRLQGEQVLVKNIEYNIANKHLEQFGKLSSVSLTDLIINAIQKYQDFESMDNLLWILMIKLKAKDHFELCNIFSKDYAPIRGGFTFKDFSGIGFENYYDACKLQPFAYPKPQKPIKRRSSIFIHDSNQMIDENIVLQHQFKSDPFQADAEIKFNQLSKQQCDYELTLSYDLSSLSLANYYVISQCFTSGNATWRMILDIDHEQNVSLYFQEKGSLKANVQFLNFDSQEDTFLPEALILDFISIILRVEVITEPNNTLISRCLFHSFPTRQGYSAGFFNLFNLAQINNQLSIKVWIVENPVHAALINVISLNFETHIRNNLSKILNCSHYDTYTMISSDQLNISSEDSLIQMLSQLDKVKSIDSDLFIFPLRFTYISNKQILTLSRDCKQIKQTRIFQDYLSLIFHWNMEINHSKLIRPRRKYKCAVVQSDQKQNSNFKEDLMSWLVNDAPKDDTKLNIDHIKQEIIKSVQKDQKNNQKHENLNTSNLGNFSQLRALKQIKKVLPLKQEVLPLVSPETQLGQSNKRFEIELPCNLI